MARVLAANSENISGRLEDVVYVRRQGKTFIRKAAKKRRDANDPKMVLNQPCVLHFPSADKLLSIKEYSEEF